MRFISLILIVLFSSCQKSEKESEKIIEQYSKLTVESITLEMSRIYASRKKLDEKKTLESLELGRKIIELLREEQDFKTCISLIKEAQQSGLYKKKAKLTLKQEKKLIERILNAEKMSSKFDQLNEVHELTIELIVDRGCYLGYQPRIILKYSDTLELKPNKRYTYPIEIIHNRVGGYVYQSDKKEIEIITGEYTDSIVEESIEIEVQNQVSGEAMRVIDNVYIKMKND